MKIKRLNGYSLKWTFINFLILPLVCLLLFEGCGRRCSYNPSPDLTSEELSWMPYVNGQILIFQSDTGSVDTVNVETLRGGHLKQEVEDPCDVGYQAIGADIYTRGGVLQIYVAHYYPDYPQNYNSASINSSRFSDASIQNNCVINGTAYNNVYVMNLNSTWTSLFGGNNIDGPVKVYFTKQNGILRFDCANGHYWVKIN